MPEEFIINTTTREKAVFMALMGIPTIIKQNNRHEFRRFSVKDINRIIEGRFETLGFMAAHEGNRSLMFAYQQKENVLRKDLAFIYTYFENHAPNAITLSFEESVTEAYRSLFR